MNPVQRRIVESLHLFVVTSLLLGLVPTVGRAAPARPIVATATITPQGGTLVTADGRVTLYFPPNAVSETVEVTVSTLAELPAPLPRGAWYEGYGLDVQIRAQADSRPIATTLRPVAITLNYAGLPDVGNTASQRLLGFYRYDETERAWERLPAEVSPASGALTSASSNFGPLVVVVDTQEELGDYAQPWSPTVQDFQVDPFTGAARWTVPIAAP